MVSDGVKTSNAQQGAVELRLSTELRAIHSQRAALELEVLNSRDFAIGQAAQIGQLRYQLVRQAAIYEQRLDDATIHITNHRDHIARLEDALREVSRNAARNAAQADSLRHELTVLRTSATWKLGRAVTLPIRAVKRLLRRG